MEKARLVVGLFYSFRVELEHTGPSEIHFELNPFSGRYAMTKQPITPPSPQPAEPPNHSPIKEPQPYKDPVEPPPGDPQEDRPMHDPVPPDGDRPR